MNESECGKGRCVVCGKRALYTAHRDTELRCCSCAIADRETAIERLRVALDSAALSRPEAERKALIDFAYCDYMSGDYDDPRGEVEHTGSSPGS